MTNRVWLWYWNHSPIIKWKRPEDIIPKKARKVRSNLKVFLTVYFDCNGVVHPEFLPQDCTVNKEYYLEVMRRLRETICQKSTEFWKKQWFLILRHDNAPAHSSMLMHEFLAKHHPHRTWPLLTFSSFEIMMKGKRFSTIEDIKEKSKQELAISKSVFQKCFEDLKNRWLRWILSEGSYFEGDKMVIKEYLILFEKICK